MSQKVAGKAVDMSLLKRIMKYVKPYKKVFYITAFTTIILAFLAPLRPILIQYTFDNHIVTPDAEGLLRMTLLMIGLLIIEGGIQFYSTYSANWLGQVVIRDIRKSLFAHILNFRLRFFDHTPIGTLVTRVISDIETIADIFSEGLLVIIGDLLKVIVIIAVMFIWDVKLALVSLATLPLLLFSTWIFKNAIKSAFQDVRTHLARLNAFVQEHLTGINIVQIFNREKIEMKKFREINAAHRDANNRSVWHYSIFLPVVEILSATSVGLLVWVGFRAVLADDVTLGDIVSFILFIHMLFRPIRELADKFNTLQMGMVSSERVFKIMDTEASMADTGEKTLERIKGEIEFRDVWFAYNEDDWVLKGITFKVKPGEKLALVGSTGSGKTSLINVLGRYYEFQKGEILLDGSPLRTYTMASLRKEMGFVLQDVFLFSASIYQNITLGNTDIPMEDVEAAAKAVGAHEFISRLPGGYQFNVRERGGMLSVGQRQLLAFIRAYLYDPSILVLDEATSSVDTESELLIQHATRKITEGRTSIIIAHRLATVRTADRILVVDHGKIIEEGSHDELITKNGQYQKLYELQFKKEETALLGE